MLQASLQQRHQVAHRPLRFRGTRVAREIRTLGSSAGPSDVPDLLPSWWENTGLKAEAAADMFRLMPVRLQGILRRGLDASLSLSLPL